MQITALDFFMLWMWTGIVTIVLFIPILGLITLFTPRVLLKRYWKKPHFQTWELRFFSGFPPYVFGRTCMFMAATFLKGGREKRQMDDYLDYVPTWFRVVSIVCLFVFCVVALIALGSPIGFGIYYWIVTGTLAWEFVLMIASLAFIVGVMIYSQSKHYQERHKRNNRKL